MFKVFTPLLALFALLASPRVDAASTAVNGVRDSLKALADTLSFQGNVHDTYAPIQDKATEAYRTIASVSDRDISDSRAQNVLWSLERLLAECQHYVTQSSIPNYVAGALETDSYLTANVAEWKVAVKFMSDHLEEPFCDVTVDQPLLGHERVSHNTEPGTVFSDLNGLPDMVVIPTGSYVAGATPEEHDTWNVDDNRRAFEYPQRNVTIKKQLAFSRTEVTVGQFASFVEHTCYEPRGGARWWDPKNFVFNANLTWKEPGFPQSPNHPVVAVTRYDAQAYARWLSTITGAVYRLPNEDEWDWAARGGSQTVFFWGDKLDLASEYANTYDNSSAEVNQFRWPSNKLWDGFPWTSPVASFKPNGFGLYDMTGNAREFTADDWQPDLSHSPNDGSVHKGPAPFPTVRGGAWNYNPKNLRINYRSAYLSSEVATNMFGIRLVRELD
jgi:formylglycine-generating enzyme required for sulfatase activity